MRESDSVFERLRAGTQGLVDQLSSELSRSPAFLRAVQQAARGKEALDRAVDRALKRGRIPTRSEFERMAARIDALEAELAELRSAQRRPARRKPAARPGGAARSARKSGKTRATSGEKKAV